MPGIADAPVAALQTGNTPGVVANFDVTPGVGDLMKSFRDGFITTEDITKRALDKPLENAQRTQALADTNIIRPKQRDLASTQLDTQAKLQPQVAEVSAAEAEIAVGKAKEALLDFKAGGDPKAFTDAWRQFFPGQPLPRKEGKIDYDGGAEDLEVEADRRRKLESAKVGTANIQESRVKRINPTTKLEEEVLVRTDKSTGKLLGETVLSSQKATLTEQEAGAQRYSSRMDFNHKILQKLETTGFDPTAAVNTVKKYLPNRFKGDDLQSYTSAKNNWIAANLRKESGAAIAKKEYDDADRQYFPQDGDSKAVVSQKQALRELAEEEMTKSIGPSAPDRQANPAAPASPAASPDAPVAVNSPAEAPATAKFIKAPDGRIFKNPNYQPVAQ